MTPLPAQPSLILYGGFVGLGVLIITLLGAALRSKGFFVVGFFWLIIVILISAFAGLNDFTGTPPRIGIFFVATLIVTILLSFSKLGRQLSLLPMSFLIGFQAFRILAEILIHQAVSEKVAPPQMSWDGINFDILSGLSALVLFPFAKMLPRWFIAIWNTLALGLLLWIVGVAFLSFPSAFQQLKPNNIWVAYFPFVWLPTVVGHIGLDGAYRCFPEVVK